MIPGTLSRMIFLDLLKVFLLALVALTGMFVLAGLVVEARQRGLGPGQVLTILPLLIPNTLPYTIPATTLFAACYVFGRMAADNEITALRSAGIHLFHVVKPALLLGSLASAATMGLYYEPIPRTYQKMAGVVTSDPQKWLYTELKRRRQISHPGLEYQVFVRDVRGDKLIDAIFKRQRKPDPMSKLPKHAQYDFIARAREAELEIDLPNNRIIARLERCHISAEHDEQGYLQQKTLEMELPPGKVFKQSFGASYLTWQELHARRDELGEQYDEQLAQRERLIAGRTPEQMTQQEREAALFYTNVSAFVKHQQRQCIAEFQVRPAMALGCLCFVAVGCPIGIWFSRGDALSSFVSCFLPVVFVYYPLTLFGGNLARDGRVPPQAGAWLADGVLAVVALLLSWRLLRR